MLTEESHAMRMYPDSKTEIKQSKQQNIFKTKEAKKRKIKRSKLEKKKKAKLDSTVESNCNSTIKTPANVSSTTKQSASTNSFPLYKVATENGELLNSQIMQSALPNMPLNNDNNLDNFSVVVDKTLLIIMNK